MFMFVDITKPRYKAICAPRGYITTILILLIFYAAEFREQVIMNGSLNAHRLKYQWHQISCYWLGWVISINRHYLYLILYCCCLRDT
jgi:hypothetical protein